MKRRASRPLRPELECAEDRLLTTVLPGAGHIAPRLAAAQVRHLAGGGALLRGSFRPVVKMFDGGPAGVSGLPTNYKDWGAISIWLTRVGSKRKSGP